MNTVKIVTITTDELSDLIRSAVRDAIAEALPEAIKQATQKPFMNNAELCKVLNISSRSAQYLRDTRQIEFIQNGRKILYSAEAVADYMKRHRIRPHL